MWELYRRTAVRTQATIMVVTLAMFCLGAYHWQPAVLAFLAMQAGAVYGSLWGVRLRGLMGRSENHLPLSSRL